MSHDEGAAETGGASENPGTDCPESGKVMNAVLANTPPTQFSVCSSADINRYFELRDEVDGAGGVHAITLLRHADTVEVLRRRYSGQLDICFHSEATLFLRNTRALLARVLVEISRAAHTRAVTHLGDIAVGVGLT